MVALKIPVLQGLPQPQGSHCQAVASLSVPELMFRFLLKFFSAVSGKGAEEGQQDPQALSQPSLL